MAPPRPAKSHPAHQRKSPLLVPGHACLYYSCHFVSMDSQRVVVIQQFHLLLHTVDTFFTNSSITGSLMVRVMLVKQQRYEKLQTESGV